jgi:hypothetical protein
VQSIAFQKCTQHPTTPEKIYTSGIPANEEAAFFPLLRPISLYGSGETSGTKVCKKYETFWLHKRGKEWKKPQQNKKHGNSDDIANEEAALC